MCSRLRSKKLVTLSLLPVLLKEKPNVNDILPVATTQTPIEKTKYDRIVDIFKLDQFGSPSKELLSCLHTACFAGILGGGIAGLKESQARFQDFATKFNSEMFVSHTEAKSALTQKMATSFVKGFAHWGSRMAFFTGLFTLNVNVLKALSDQTSIWHFVTSGFVTGSIYRIPMGARAMLAAGTVGGFLGLCTGCVSVGLFNLFGTSYDEIEAWHYQVRNLREEQFKEHMDQHMASKQSNPILEDRDKLLKKASLEALKETSQKEQAVAKT